MRMSFLKNMMGVSIVSLTVLSSVAITSLTFSAVSTAKMKKQGPQASNSSVIITKDRTADVQNRLLRLLEGHNGHTLTDEDPNLPKMIAETTAGKVDKQALKGLNSQATVIKHTTANVEKKLMRLVGGVEEQNPPDGNLNFLQGLSEPAMPGEQNSFIEDEMNISTPQIDAEDEQIQMEEAFNDGIIATRFKMNRKRIKPHSVGAFNEDHQIAPQDSDDPRGEGTSKGGRHKGQHFHQQRTGAHLIPIIRMGETPQENNGLTIIKPWDS